MVGLNIESEVGLCSWDWKRSCFFHDRLHSLPWTEVFVLTKFWWMTPFTFHPVKGICEHAFCLFSLLCLEFETWIGVQQYWYVFDLCVLIGIHDCSAILLAALDLYPNLTSDLGYLGDLTSWIFWKLVHVYFNIQIKFPSVTMPQQLCKQTYWYAQKCYKFNHMFGHPRRVAPFLCWNHCWNVKPFAQGNWEGVTVLNFV